MVLKYLIEKEFKQMRRNPIIPRLNFGVSLHDDDSDAVGSQS